MSEPTWVVGSGGLLGQSVVEELKRRDTSLVQRRVRWTETDRALDDLRQGARDLLYAAGGGPWSLVWCAGAGVTGAQVDHLERELATLRVTLEELGAAGSTGRVLLASSAGGVFAGSTGAPHDESTQPRPLAPYGAYKLAAEKLLTDWAEETRARAVVARYSNLYGPRQDLRKPQGLISHLCRGFLTAQPVSIYVPIDTLRDYFYVDDAAALTADLLAAAPDHGQTLVKICASGQSISIAGLVSACSTVFRRRPRVIMGSSALSAAQATDLRVRSRVLPDLDRRETTPLASGIAATLAGTRIRLFT